jgi:hypothetical protein
MKRSSRSRASWLFAACASAVFAMSGLSIPAVAQNADTPAAKQEVKERKVTLKLEDLPEEIRAAIKGAVPDGEVVKIEQEVEGEDPGQYDVDVRADGRLYEVEISPEGRVKEVKARESTAERAARQKGKKWTERFHIDDCKFSSTGRNRYFVLEPGHQLTLESADEKVVITVLDETVRVGDVETRVLEEREWEVGQLKEVSRNFFAICNHGDVFYFGEDVDMYKDGKVVKHSGEWRADRPNSQAGIIMPGTILLGARHYQEIAPNAQDRAEILADDVTLKTPAGEFKDCLRVDETSGLDPKDQTYKTYAPGIGMIQDEDLLLTSWRAAP